MAAGRKPTDVAGCQLRLADFSTLTAALDYAALGRAGLNFYSSRGELIDVLPYRELRQQATSLARRMRRAGLAAGERAALVAETGGGFVRAFFACQYAGVGPVPFPAPAAFGGRAAYVDHVRPMLASARPAAVLAPGPYLSMIRQAAEHSGTRLVGTFEQFDDLPEDGTDLPRIGEDDLSYLQFSSGSTRAPTGVAVTQRALLANLRGILHALDARAGDRCMSWLPFYHDMGLVGFVLAPLASQASTDYVATDEFARRPLIWPTLIARNGGTISYGPSFGYELCTRRAMIVSVADLDLSRWRVAGIGGDMIRPAVLSRFAEAFRPAGFRRDAFVASYGMAEATLGICFAPLDRGIEIDRVDLDLLREEGRAVPAHGGTARARELVLCGRVLPGHELEIRNAHGRRLAERKVGRILSRGPSVMREYFGNRAETERVLSCDGWLDTGDLGYLTGGSLVVAGRAKDLILVNGRNVWPQDLEWAVEHQVDGVRQGDVAAFSLDRLAAPEAERVVLLVACRTSDGAERRALRQATAEVVLATAGLHCTVVLVPHNALPRTSSGKLSRTRAREMYLASLQAPARVGAAQAIAPELFPAAGTPV
jgi:fatty-acyl-CoA synthase